MKKVLKWVGLAMLAMLVVAGVAAFQGMGEVRGLTIGAVDLARVPDGAFEGEYKAGRFHYKVLVTVEGAKVTDVETLTAPMGREGVLQGLEQRVLDEQTPALDAVTGASLDGKAWLKAVENALAGAAN
ncbi:MAG TPA: FMN-binding protein [Candidatus Limnocylindria bacterium]|nr:FMN-binding protein [Candidatus Limnocylindria bacterium]